MSTNPLLAFYRIAVGRPISRDEVTPSEPTELTELLLRKAALPQVAQENDYGTSRVVNLEAEPPASGDATQSVHALEEADQYPLSSLEKSCVLQEAAQVKHALYTINSTPPEPKAQLSDDAIQSVPWFTNIAASFPGFSYLSYAAQGLLYYGDKATPAVSNLLVYIVKFGVASFLLTGIYTFLQFRYSKMINGPVKDIITILQAINFLLIGALALMSSIVNKFYLENGIA
jgi:hypothetical protein